MQCSVSPARINCHLRAQHKKSASHWEQLETSEREKTRRNWNVIGGTVDPNSYPNHRTNTAKRTRIFARRNHRLLFESTVHWSTYRHRNCKLKESHTNWENIFFGENLSPKRIQQHFINFWWWVWTIFFFGWNIISFYFLLQRNRSLSRTQATQSHSTRWCRELKGWKNLSENWSWLVTFSVPILKRLNDICFSQVTISKRIEQQARIDERSTRWRGLQKNNKELPACFEHAVSPWSHRGRMTRRLVQFSDSNLLQIGLLDATLHNWVRSCRIRGWNSGDRWHVWRTYRRQSVNKTIRYSFSCETNQKNYCVFFF